MRQLISWSAVGCAAAIFVLPGAGAQAAVVVGPGSFEYRYNSQNATGTGAADPNAVTSANLIFSGDGGAPNQPFNFVNFYRFGANPADQSPTNPSVETLTYTFDASAGQEFDGNASVTDRINVFGFQGNVRAEFSTDGGASFTDYTQRGTEGPERATNLIDIDGATSVILRYNVASIAAPEREDQVQLFRQANVGLAGTEETPFVFSGTTVEAIPEPAGLAVLGLGGLLALRRRNR